MPTAAAIALEGIAVSYDSGNTFAVSDVDLIVLPGAFVAVVGGSGSGKTTTLKTINRLVEPSAGTVRIDGEDVRMQPAHEVRRRIGYVFQGIGLFPHMTVGENVSVTPRLLGWDKGRITARRPLWTTSASQSPPGPSSPWSARPDPARRPC